MICKRCGAALPNKGFVCKSCGAMMDQEQIKKQKKYMQDEKNNKIVTLLSDQYSKEPIHRDYEKKKENKLLGAILIILILVVLIVFTILKNLS